jgi:hypothetical protein
LVGELEEIDFVYAKKSLEARNGRPNGRQCEKTARQQFCHSHITHHSNYTNWDRTKHTDDPTVIRDESTDPPSSSSINRDANESGEKSYVDCPSSQRAGDDMCYDEHVLYRHRSQVNDVARVMVLVLMINMTLRKSVPSTEGRVTQLLAKKREGRYRMDPTSVQPIETHSRERETKLAHLQAKLAEDSLKSSEREGM